MVLWIFLLILSLRKQERLQRRRGDRRGGTTSDDAICADQEPGAAGHPGGASVARTGHQGAHGAGESDPRIIGGVWHRHAPRYHGGAPVHAGDTGRWRERIE